MHLHAILLAIVAILAHSAMAQMAVQSGMTADSHCGAGYCVTGVYLPSTKMVNYTLVVPKGGQSGWYGFAQGTGMAGANMAIAWVNADQSRTISHRSAGGHQQPAENLAQNSAFSVNSGVSGSTSSQTVWSWNMAVPSSGSMSSVEHIYAFSAVTPTSSNTGASIRKHSSYEEGITLDLTKAYTGGAPSGLAGATATVTSSGSSQGSGGSTSSSSSSAPKRDLGNNTVRIFLVHMIFMIIGWMICFPLGILIARYGRTFFSWFPAHRIAQTIGFLFIFIGFFLGIGGVASYGGSHLSNTHEKTGLALFVLLFVQTLLGVASHSLKKRTGKRIIGLLHWPLGLLLFALSVWQIHTGFEEWQWQPPAYASYIIYAWAGLIALLYLIGFILLPREIRQYRDEKAPQSLGSDSQEQSFHRA